MSSCEDCGIQFENYDFLMDHKNSLQILKCRKCPKMFPNACERYVHTTKKQCQELLLGCNYCNMKFANIQNLDKHKSSECELIKQSGDKDNILINLLDVQEKLKEHNKILAVQNFYDKNPQRSDYELEVLANQIGAGKSAVELWFKNIKSNVEPSSIFNKPIPPQKIISQYRNYSEPAMEEENVDDPIEENVNEPEGEIDNDPEEENFSDLNDVPTSQPSIAPNDLDSNENLEGNFQKSILEQFFNKKPYPNYTDLSNLAIATNLRERIVKVWFKKKRESQEFKEVQQESRDILDLDRELQKSTNALLNPPLQNGATLFSSQFINQKNKKKSKFQLDILERMLAVNTHPDKFKLKELSKITGLDVQVVKNWFVNNRKRTDVKMPQDTVAADNQRNMPGLTPQEITPLDTKDIVSKLFQQETVESKELVQEEKEANLDSKLSEDNLNEETETEDSNKEKMNFKLVGEIKFNGSNTPIETSSKLNNPVEEAKIEGSTEDFNSEDFGYKMMGDNSNEVNENQLKRPRLSRVTIQHFQKEILEIAFGNISGNYPSGDQYESLVNSTGMTKAQIRNWFQNKKTALRKESTDIPEHMKSWDQNVGMKQRLSYEQREILETAFENLNGNYPYGSEYEYLVISTGMTKDQLRIWFMNKKSALRKKSTDLIEHLKSGDQNIGSKQRLPHEQRTILENEFSRNPYPSKYNLDELTKSTGLRRNRIYQWFTNKRAALKAKTKLQGNDQENFQIYLLESAFKQNTNPNPYDLLNLAKTTQLELPIVKTWFTNRRAKSQNEAAETRPKSQNVAAETRPKSQNETVETKANLQNEAAETRTKLQNEAAETKPEWQNEATETKPKWQNEATETAYTTEPHTATAEVLRRRAKFNEANPLNPPMVTPKDVGKKRISPQALFSSYKKSLSPSDDVPEKTI